MGKNSLDIVSIKLVRDRSLYSEKNILTPKDAINIVGCEICDFDREVFCVASLNAKNQPINLNFASIGTLNSSLIHPREIFKAAILSNASSVIVLHNHPSGCLNPSKEDKEVTERLMKAGELLGIPVLDHIIIGNKGKAFSLIGNRTIEYDLSVLKASLDEQIKVAELERKDVKNNFSFEREH